ncbi:MAG: LysM peptidoglycan-binding domain-containing protein [Chloroflexi bacterium]|nr:LysM peptidoglycan-binding domain-containing protein [Chloroflexota bacterium]
MSLLPAQAQQIAEVTHIVRPGETLGLIAQRYSVDLYSLAALNGISNAHVVYSWQRLTIPAEAELGAPAVEALGVHIVQRGETLESIAKSYGIDLFELQALNNLWTWLIYPGDEVALPVEGRQPETAADNEELPATPPQVEIASEYSHTVKSGETLGTIAISYGVSLYDLQQLNNIWGWLIYPGQELAIPAGGTPPPESSESEPADSTATTAETAPAATIETTPAVKPDTHTVQRGETLFSIARQYGVPLDLLMQANGISDPHRVHSGLVLRIRNLEAAIPPQNINPGAGPAPNANRERYTVLPGEFLSTIGNKFGMSWLAIAAVNGITNPDAIHAGTVLQIPTQEEAARYGPVIPVHLDPGAHIGVGREIVIVLSTQRTYAYENGILQRSAIISSGLPDTPTVQGNFKITRKTPSRHMVGPGYDLPNVPWVSYFYAGYAIHGTYWHNNFGTPMSHGCVNMTTPDAKWFYDFAPVGTPVHVRY